MTEVSVGLVRRNGLLLLGQRMPHREFPLTWEFPGGKVEAGETPSEALARELNEEVGICILDATEIHREESKYLADHLMIYHLVTDFLGNPKVKDHMGLRWMSVSGILTTSEETLPLIHNDVDILQHLIAFDRFNCSCDQELCVCETEKNHMDSCRYCTAACLPLPLECSEHGHAICIKCDQCTCP